MAIVALTPAADRPYVGGSTGNSIINLIFGYNGLGRISGNTGAGGGGGAGGEGAGPRFSGATGLTRLFNTQMGGQISWLLPAALVALVGGLWLTKRAPRTDRHRAALLLWGVWLIVSAVVYSYASGIIHTYYTNTLAPAIAAPIGITAVALWQKRDRIIERLLLSAMLAATAGWSYSLLDRTPNWHPWLRFAVLGGGLVTAVAIALAGGRLPRPALAALAAAGLLAGLGGSLAYTLSTVTSAQNGALVSAGPASAGGRLGGFTGGAGRTGAPPTGGGFPGGAAGGAPPTGTRPTGAPSFVPGGRTGTPGGFGGGTTSKALTALLAKDAARYTWVAATGSSNSAAPIALATGKPVMALGGFTGSDPAMTLARFQRLVAAGRIHYYLGSGNGGGPGGGQGISTITTWVAKTFTPTTVAGTTVYDLTSRTSS